MLLLTGALPGHPFSLRLGSDLPLKLKFIGYSVQVQNSEHQQLRLIRKWSTLLSSSSWVFPAPWESSESKIRWFVVLCPGCCLLQCREDGFVWRGNGKETRQENTTASTFGEAIEYDRFLNEDLRCAALKGPNSEIREPRKPSYTSKSKMKT